MSIQLNKLTNKNKIIMGKTLTVGKGRIIELDIDAKVGICRINGRGANIKELNETMATLSDGTKIDISSVRLTALFARVQDSGSKYDGKDLPIKFSQWKYVRKDINKLVDIEIVQPDTGDNVMAKTVARQPRTEE